MARHLIEPDDTPFDNQLKALADEELLDFWAETQQLEGLLQAEFQQRVEPAQDYERMILHELQMRSVTRKSL